MLYVIMYMYMFVGTLGIGLVVGDWEMIFCAYDNEWTHTHTHNVYIEIDASDVLLVARNVDDLRGLA